MSHTRCCLSFLAHSHGTCQRRIAAATTAALLTADNADFPAVDWSYKWFPASDTASSIRLQLCFVCSLFLPVQVSPPHSPPMDLAFCWYVGVLTEGEENQRGKLLHFPHLIREQTRSFMTCCFRGQLVILSIPDSMVQSFSTVSFCLYEEQSSESHKIKTMPSAQLPASFWSDRRK